ncbi:MAG: hypothetical protein LBU45_09470 [Azoarcus sp.]|nr:hypothetical protein [Azoarcus sp.]
MRRIDLLLLATLVMPLCVAGQGTQKTSSVFSCEINGRPVFGDTLPKECYGHAWVRKINGVIVYREAAQPTPDESAMRRERARQEEIARKEAAKQKRQDEALLERYRSLADLDNRRDREIADLDNAIADLRVQERELLERHKKIDEDVKAAASNNNPLPDDLARAATYADEELAQSRAAIERKVTERDNLRQRFDADRRHYIELTTSAKPGKPE